MLKSVLENQPQLFQVLYRPQHVSGFYSNNRIGDFEQPTRMSKLADPYSLINEKQQELIETYMKMHGGKRPNKKNIKAIPGVLGNVSDILNSRGISDSIYKNSEQLAQMILDGGIFRFGNIQGAGNVSSQAVANQPNQRFNATPRPITALPPPGPPPSGPSDPPAPPPPGPQGGGGAIRRTRASQRYLALDDLDRSPRQSELMDSTDIFGGGNRQVPQSVLGKRKQPITVRNNTALDKAEVDAAANEVINTSRRMANFLRSNQNPLDMSEEVKDIAALYRSSEQILNSFQAAAMDGFLSAFKMAQVKDSVDKLSEKVKSSGIVLNQVGPAMVPQNYPSVSEERKSYEYEGLMAEIGKALREPPQDPMGQNEASAQLSSILPTYVSFEGKMHLDLDTGIPLEFLQERDRKLRKHIAELEIAQVEKDQGIFYPGMQGKRKAMRTSYDNEQYLLEQKANNMLLMDTDNEHIRRNLKRYDGDIEKDKAEMKKLVQVPQDNKIDTDKIFPSKFTREQLRQANLSTYAFYNEAFQARILREMGHDSDYQFGSEPPIIPISDRPDSESSIPSLIDQSSIVRTSVQTYSSGQRGFGNISSEVANTINYIDSEISMYRSQGTNATHAYSVGRAIQSASDTLNQTVSEVETSMDADARAEKYIAEEKKAMREYQESELIGLVGHGMAAHVIQQAGKAPVIAEPKPPAKYPLSIVKDTPGKDEEFMINTYSAFGADWFPMKGWNEFNNWQLMKGNFKR